AIVLFHADVRNFCLFFGERKILEFAGFLSKVKQFSGTKFSILSFETNGTRCQIWLEIVKRKRRAPDSSFIKQQKMMKCASSSTRAFLWQAINLYCSVSSWPEPVQPLLDNPE